MQEIVLMFNYRQYLRFWMMSFAVIEFAIDEKIDIVPTKWIFEKNSLTRTNWPSLFTGTIYETVLAARGKLKRLENDTETSDGTGRRKRKPNSRYGECTFLPPRKVRKTYASSASSMSISETSSLNSAPRMPKSIQSDANASSPTKMPCSGSLVRVNNSRSLSPKNNQVDLTQVSKSSNIEERPPTQCSKVNARILANHSPSTSGASTRFMDLVFSNSDQEFKSKVISSLSYLKMKVDQLSQSQEVIAEKLAQTPKLPVNFRIALPVKTITEFEDLESRVANDPDLYAELVMIKVCK
ncbi:unnamed protein product [Allacma fusca]|uniref:Uncharacterized protein n=1 Tax=Allacma fusca TaxID=39272 RepID=A0A8J2P842_9HEXA|nr:unnamed protein product [Allacma fusca]